MQVPAAAERAAASEKNTLVLFVPSGVLCTTLCVKVVRDYFNLTFDH